MTTRERESDPSAPRITEIRQEWYDAINCAGQWTVRSGNWAHRVIAAGQALLDALAASQSQVEQMQAQVCTLADAAGERESIAALLADRDEMTVYLKVAALLDALTEAQQARDEAKQQNDLSSLGGTASGNATDERHVETPEQIASQLRGYADALHTVYYWLLKPDEGPHGARTTLRKMADYMEHVARLIAVDGGSVKPPGTAVPSNNDKDKQISTLHARAESAEQQLTQFRAQQVENK